jgi:hypothetical protein
MWKQYGGINKLDNQNNIVVNTLTTDFLTVNNPYVGDFDICGNLIVQNSFAVLGNVSLSDNLKVKNNVDISGNLSISGSVTALSNFNIQDINLAGNMVVNGALSQFVNNIIAQGNVQVNNRIILDPSGDVFLQGNDNKIGINVRSPQATLDICGNAISSLNVFSNNVNTRNIIAQNRNRNGIAVAVDTSYSVISFYNDNSLNSGISPGSTITYNNGGSLVIDASNNTIVASQLIVSERNNTSHVFNTTASIYDTSNGVFMYNTYRNGNISTGTALSLVSLDNSSNTFLNITTPNKKGLLMCGGSYPLDMSRSMSSFGYLDKLGGYVPSQMIVSGNNVAKMQSTIGINTYAPRTEKYVLDINGPIHICNGDIKTTFVSNSEITSISKSAGYLNNFIAVGSPVKTTRYYTQYAYRSTNGGQSWSETRIDNRIDDDNTLEVDPLIFRQAYSYDNSFAIIVNDKAVNYYTINAGETWYTLNIGGVTETEKYNTNAVYIDNSHVYIAGNSVDISSNIYIFENFYSPISPPTGEKTIPSGLIITMPIGEKVRSMFGSGNFLYVSTTSNLIAYNKSTTSMNSKTAPSFLYSRSDDIPYNSIHSINGSIAIAVGYQKIIYTKDNGASWSPRGDSRFNTLNGVFIIDTSNAVAVGSNATIVYSTDGYFTWNPIPYEILNAAGNAMELLDPSNNFINVTMTDINTIVVSATTQTYISTTPKVAGKSKLYYLYVPNLFNKRNNTVLDLCGNMNIDGNVNVNNNIVVRTTLESAKYEGIINYTTNTSGNIDIGTYALNKNINIGGVFVQTGVKNVITIGGPYDTINIGGNISQTGDAPSYLGNSVVNGYLTVATNATINGNSTINSNTDSTNSITGALVVAGGVGIGKNTYIGKSLFVNDRITTQTEIDSTSAVTGAIVITNGGGLGVSGNAFIGRNANITGNVNILGTGESGASNEGALTVAGGVGIGANVYVGGNTVISRRLVLNGNNDTTGTGTGTLIITGGTSMTGNAFIGGNLTISQNAVVSSTTNSNSATSGALTVSGGAGIVGNAFIGGNVRVLSTIDSTSITRGALTVAGGVGITGNTYIGGNVSIANTTQITSSIESTSTTTGALTITGGIGIGANATIGGNVLISSLTDVSGLGTGAFIVYGGASITKGLQTNGNITSSGILRINNTFDPINIGAGAIYLPNGGASIGGNIFGGKNITSSGILRTNATTDCNSIGTGAMIVNGGTSLAGNVYVGGNLVTTNVNASAIFGGSIVSTSTTDAQNTSTGAMRLSGGMSVTGNAFIGGNVGITNGLLVSGDIASTNNTTGALRVTGGAGIRGNLYVGGITQIDGNVLFTRTTPSVSTNTGAAIVYGGIGIGGNTYIGGNISVLSTTSSIDASSGSITTLGGLGVRGNVNIGGSISFAGGLVGPVVINEPIGTTLSPTTGTLVLNHNNINGESSIVFPSKTNYGSDYAYIRFQDNVRVGSLDTESALLTIGIQNDSNAGSNLDRINFDSGVIGMSNSSPNNTYKLDVGGGVNASFYNATSDYRIKENVQELEITEYNIDKLRPVHYDNKSTGKHDIGFIAHEIQEHYPFLVNGDKDGVHTQSVNYIGLIGVLVKEIQVLKKEIAELKVYQ